MKKIVLPPLYASNVYCKANFFFPYLENSYFLIHFQVVAPLLSNSRNHTEWPQVVSLDVRHHVHSLKTNVFVVSGQVQGKTLLPLPVDSERVEQAALESDKM